MLKNLIVLFLALLFAASAFCQNTLSVILKDKKSGEALIGATAMVRGTSIGTSSDKNGLLTLSLIRGGKQVIEFRYVGFETQVDTLVFPLIDSSRLVIKMQEEGKREGKELDEVVVSTTRSSRILANIPTRIEIISSQELEEKASMKPGDIRMLLAESTGIQTQQTSATSGNSSIRIQGLDGKYTQVIRDGFPLYAGFSGGLGLLQVAPLDLKQVEIIKGSSSTLYGGGAIAGLVNLISKTPAQERQLSFIANGTSALGFDLSTFYSQKFKTVGTTVYAAYNHGSAYDPSNTGFTAVPRYDRFTLNPKLFIAVSSHTTLIAGLNTTIEKRTGGDISFIKNGASAGHSYFEQNKTGRYSTQIELDHTFNDNEKLIIKNSLSYFDRSIDVPDYRFSGVQLSTYTEANYLKKGMLADWVAGITILSDKFTEHRDSNLPLRNYNYQTIGAFIQNTWNVNKQFTVESGLRTDYHNVYGFFLLPRVSALWKINPHLSTRLGGGLGYKAPSLFTEDAERIQFRNVLPIDMSKTRAERSYGTNYDLTYKTSFFYDQLGFTINQLFFYTVINNPILLRHVSGGDLQYLQPAGNLNTRGLETNIKLSLSDFKLFLGYTLSDVHQKAGNVITLYPLVSTHRLNNVLMYEIENKLKIGLEAYYFSPQKLNDGGIGKGYWTAGLMVERTWHHLSLFINFENITDTRQTRFDTIYTGSMTSPVFRDVYAPLDGFIVNGGVKIRL